LPCELDQVCITGTSVGDPDVQVETVLTAQDVISKNIELHTPICVLSGFQDACAGRVSKSTLLIHSLILDSS